MYLKKNDKIIDFELTDYLGNRIKSSDYKGQKVYLSFFTAVLYEKLCLFAFYLQIKSTLV